METQPEQTISTSGTVANEMRFSATLVLVAKFPQLGKCKTRLAAHPAVGPQLAFDFAQAAILDILSRFGDDALDTAVTKALSNRIGNNEDNDKSITNIASSKVQRIVAYAPADVGEQFHEWVKSELGSKLNWEFVPFDSSVVSNSQVAMPANVAASHLSAGLQNALQQYAGGMNGSPVVFIGMDTPHLSIHEVAQGVRAASAVERADKQQTTPLQPPSAYICPATDGGYVMLALPSCARDKNVFDPLVLVWSTTYTFATQVKAITDAGIGIKVGQSFCDVDERGDICELAEVIRSDPELVATLPRLAALLPKLNAV